MNPNAVLLAGRQGKQSVTVLVATVRAARCFLQYARSAAKTPKYLSSLEVTNLFTAATAIAKSEIDNIG